MIGQGFRVDPSDIHGRVARDAAVLERLRDTQIRIVQLDVFAHQRDGDSHLGMAEGVHHLLPLGQIQGRLAEPQALADDGSEPLLLEGEGRLIQQRNVAVGDDILPRDVAEQGHLVLEFPGDRLLGTANDDIGLDAQGEQLLDGMLGRLGLHLLRSRDIGHEGDMEEEAILPAVLDSELADGLQEG